MLEVLCAFLTFRIVVLLVFERGPVDVFLRFRKWVGIIYDDRGREIIGKRGFWAHVLSCAWCTSIWVGVGVVLGLKLLHMIEPSLGASMPFWYGLAFSGAAILLIERGL